MSIRKRYNKDGSYTWEFCITIQKQPRKQYRKSGYKTKIDAQTAEREAINRYIDGLDLRTAENMTFSQLCEEYLETCSNKAKSTRCNYNNVYKNHLQYFYNYKISEIKSLTVQKWVNTCGKTPCTINESLKFCKAVFNYAIRHNLLARNPFLYIDKPKIKQKERRRLSLDEAINLLKICRDTFPDFYPILATQIFTGPREGELLALKWQDLDFNNGKLRVCRQYTNGELKDSLKTSSSYRTVDICPTLIKILQEHRRRQGRISEFIFINSAGGPHNPRNLICRRFEPLLEKIYGDKKYMRFYDLRGTYVDILLAEGVPLKYIQSQVGHSNYNTTMNAYSKLIKDVNDHAVNVLEKTVSIEGYKKEGGLALGAIRTRDLSLNIGFKTEEEVDL